MEQQVFIINLLTSSYNLLWWATCWYSLGALWCALVVLPCVGTVYTVCGPLQTTTTSMNISLSFALQSAGTTKYALGEEACADYIRVPACIIKFVALLHICWCSIEQNLLGILSCMEYCQNQDNMARFFLSNSKLIDWKSTNTKLFGAKTFYIPIFSVV